MKILKSAFLLAICLSFSIVVAQDNAFTRHTVGKGETVTQIAKRYKVTPHDIFRLNPDAQAGVKENDVLLIPQSGVAAAKPHPSTHTVKAKETLFGISKTYGVTVDALKQANPIVADGLKVGQVIKIPNGTTVGGIQSQAVASVAKPTSMPAFHVVAPKETKFGISKQYGLTVADLERLNPGIEQNLPIGYKLKIASGSTEAEKPAPKIVTLQENETIVDQYEVIKTTKKTAYANYEVKPKETLFGLAKEFGTTEEELIRLNPMLKDGVKVGMILKVPGKGSITLVEDPKKDLAQSISKDKKQLVLLLPFNATRIKGDTAKTLTERLKKDAFLNMTLDFYAGALIAIDSAKALGLNVEVKILDSEESKNGSAVNGLAKDRTVRSADAIIGPFYQQYAEKLAEQLVKDSIPVISPLSKEDGKPFPNLYQSMPSSSFTKRSMFAYMMAKGGNILIVSDPKRAANREFITQNFAGAKFVPLDENGNFVPDNLKTLLIKDKLNYVVIDSEKTGMILSTTNALLNEMANYQIQLAIIEPNETLDYEEISMKRLTILKLLYPSITRENNSPEAQIFDKKFREANKVFPNQYAVRGFDVTFDTLLRMTQAGGFSASAGQSTQQVQSRFVYGPTMDNGVMNHGLYILEFQEDLSVKQAQ